MPGDGVEPFVAGFRHAYSTIAQHSESFIDEILGSNVSTRVRILWRPTRFYTGILSQMMQQGHPALAQDVESVLASLDVADNPRLAPVIAAEKDALLRLDVPRFTASIADRSLRPDHCGGVIDDWFDDTPIERISHRIRSMNDDDCEARVEHIRAVYALDSLRRFLR